MKKKIFSLLIISFLALSFLKVSLVSASSNKDYFGVNFVKNGTATGSLVLGDKDPRKMAAQIINVILTLLATVAVVIVLLGGFKWMTAGGNEDKVGEAKKLLGAGIIGLVIILAAWGITTFVLKEVMDATGN